MQSCIGRADNGLVHMQQGRRKSTDAGGTAVGAVASAVAEAKLQAKQVRPWDHRPVHEG